MATAKKAPAKAAVATKAAPAKKAAVAAKAPAKKAAAKTAAPAVKRTANAAFMKAVTPSPQLAAIIGATPMPRTEVTKKLWEYIKAHKLQDAAKKTNINADAKLSTLLKLQTGDSLTYFNLQRFMKHHFVKATPVATA